MRNWFAAALFWASLPAWAGGGNSVGNGGDVLTHYLLSTRHTLLKSLERARIDPAWQTLLCEEQEMLTVEQRLTCREFVLEAGGAMLGLVRDRPPVELKIVDDPILVEGLDGAPMRVDARTLLGPKGPIEFHFDNVRHYSPMQLLRLMAHEVGHKVVFRGAFVEDNLAVGPFASGRELLDAAGAALAHLAKKEGFVGGEFVLYDDFACWIDPGPGAVIVPRGGGPVQRRFAQEGSFDRYKIRFGEMGGATLIADERMTGSYLAFRFEIHEESACRKEDGIRWTRVEIARGFKRRGSEPPRDEILSSVLLEGFNPVCGKPDTEERALKLAFEGIVFQCSYTGSFGRSPDLKSRNLRRGANRR